MAKKPKDPSDEAPLVDPALRDRLQTLMSEPGYEPLTIKKLGRRLQVNDLDYPSFRDQLKRMLRAGVLARTPEKGMVLPESLAARTKAPVETRTKHKGAGSNLVTGTFRRTRKGFGYARPGKSASRDEDIYIPAEATLDASTGDEVAVQVLRRSHARGGKREGRIVRVVNRASGLFVGTYFEELGSGFVKVDGTTFGQPIAVGDPGAKGARPGDKVAIEIVRYPTPFLDGEGVIVELLGPRGQPGVDTLSVIRALNIPDTFDDETLQDAREQAKRFDEERLDGRSDLRDVLTVTIDPATARDFDDAITLSQDDRGFWHLGVHIADVSHFVTPGSPLDRSAKTRGNSVYLPDRVIPMLPEILSNSLASLQEGHTRYTVSALLEFDPEGIPTHKEFARSAIRVDKRFSYEQAFAVMSAPETAHAGVSPEVAALLGRMLRLARMLRARRVRRGALELNMPEVEIDLGSEGQVVGAHLASDDESHQVIEEFMLAANEAVAAELTARKAGFLRRGHADPEPRKLLQFAEFAQSLGLTIERPQDRFELQKVLAEAATRPEVFAVHYGLLRSMKQATYTAEFEGHYALASEDYCHFTSPIRRYPDLQVHRQLVALLEGKKPRSDADELTMLAEHCTSTERRAQLAEREVTRIKLLSYLEDKIGQEFSGVIIGVEDFGVFVQLREVPAEGLVHVTALADDYYYLESETHTLVGRGKGRRLGLGDPVQVRIARVDIDRRELDLVFAQDHPEGQAFPTPRRERPRSTSRSRSTARPAGATGNAGANPPRTKKSPKHRKPKPKPKTKTGKKAKGKRKG